MKTALALTALVAVVALAASWFTSPAGQLQGLIAQLAGGPFIYDVGWDGACKPRGLPARLLGALLVRGAYEGPANAARGLGAMGPAAAPAVPALLRALAEGPNDYDTGDGVIPVRTCVALALGRIGDPRAIVPLGESLARGAPAERDAGAAPGGEPAAQHALIEALGRFGPAARSQAPAVVAVLERCNARAGEHVAQMRLQFERSEALDPTSPEYRRGLERRSANTLAGRAIETLAAMQATEALPAVVAALATPAAAEVAARSLPRFGAAASAALPALRALLDADAAGPAAKAAAGKALAELGDEGVVPWLVGALREPDLTLAAAEALGLLGPRAAVAVPALGSVLATPSGVVVGPGGSRRYDVEATRRLSWRHAAVTALQRIATDAARDELARWRHDPEVGRRARTQVP